jgi:DNA-binding GntR family transcriptional regulator
VDLRSFTDKVYEQIRLDILAGRRRPGERIDIVELTKTLGVSSQPVREALIRLTNEGLVTVRPRRGTFVTVVTPQDICEINQAREMLESYALTHHLPFTEQDLTPLQSALAAMDAVLTQASYHYLDYNTHDFAFHKALVGLAHNTRLVRMYQWLHPHFVYAMVMYQHATTLLGRHEDHREILDALEANQLDQALALVHQHIRQATDTLLRLMTSNAPSPKAPDLG